MQIEILVGRQRKEVKRKERKKSLKEECERDVICCTGCMRMFMRSILECTTGDLHWKCSSFHCELFPVSIPRLAAVYVTAASHFRFASDEVELSPLAHACSQKSNQDVSWSNALFCCIAYRHVVRHGDKFTSDIRCLQTVTQSAPSISAV
jgi:hypothetical protein